MEIDAPFTVIASFPATGNMSHLGVWHRDDIQVLIDALKAGGVSIHGVSEVTFESTDWGTCKVSTPIDTQFTL